MEYRAMSRIIQPSPARRAADSSVFKPGHDGVRMVAPQDYEKSYPRCSERPYPACVTARQRFALMRWPGSGRAGKKAGERALASWGRKRGNRDRPVERREAQRLGGGLRNPVT